MLYEILMLLFIHSLCMASGFKDNYKECVEIILTYSFCL
ncbi:hypothetical protein GGR14_001143 [Butyricimonas faecihominis]|uniref:Uncharacterized protein n=1 Tax=Butyricimonas faecihominis TaxID=1472416 RepID=A0A7W6MXY9_9BACT|nr:hypothetical protein [Butyricimonas faecihominis]